MPQHFVATDAQRDTLQLLNFSSCSNHFIQSIKHKVISHMSPPLSHTGDETNIR